MDKFPWRVGRLCDYDVVSLYYTHEHNSSGARLLSVTMRKGLNYIHATGASDECVFIELQEQAAQWEKGGRGELLFRGIQRGSDGRWT